MATFENSWRSYSARRYYPFHDWPDSVSSCEHLAGSDQVSNDIRLTNIIITDSPNHSRDIWCSLRRPIPVTVLEDFRIFIFG